MSSSRTRISSLSWLWRDGYECLSSNREERLTYLTPDGSVLERSLKVDSFRFPVPDSFFCHRQLWRRYLRLHPADAFELAFERKLSRGPWPGMLRLPLVWTVYVVFTSPALGRRILSHVDWGGLPPSRILLERLIKLRRIDHLLSQSFQDQTVLLPAEVLLNALSSSMEHAMRLSAELGHWSGWPQGAYGLSSKSLRFVPNSSASAPPGAWRALDYDADRYALICSTPDGPYVRLNLGQPFYRFARKLCFTTSCGSCVIKGKRYLMPDAWLCPNETSRL